jgi:Tol biopolymer transport system component
MDRLGIYSPDQKLLAFPMNNETVIERLSTGEQWQIPNGGRSVSFSPDGDWLAWTGGDFTPPFDRAEREVWVSRVDGSEARQVFTAIRGGFAGWLSGERILVSGLVEGTASEQAYWALSLNPILVEQSELMELGRGGRLREAKISSDGSWLAYLVTFGADPSQDGLWLAEAISGERKRLEVFGGYNWRDGEHLLVVPLDLSEPVHELLQVHAPSGHVEPLTDPSITPFRIANGDWSVSPDGGKIVFVSADDGNIWVLDISEFIK